MADHGCRARHCAEGIGIWQWASNDQDTAPDVAMACGGDVPTLETLAAVSIMHEHLPDLKIRVVNAVDLMKLQPRTEHPHGLSDPISTNSSPTTSRSFGTVMSKGVAMVPYLL